MAVIVVCTLCFVNLLLWFLFFKKFKKIFSTEDIIENTRNELNRMILDVNRNAERNITLIESRLTELKEIISQADSRVSFLKSELEKNMMADSYKSKVSGLVKSSGKGTFVSDTSAVQAAARYSAFAKNADTHQSELQQQSLFSQEDAQVQENNYKEVPVLGGNIRMAENPIVMKKSFNDEVNERYMRGESVEEIASLLGRSVTEVQFALDMNI